MSIEESLQESAQRLTEVTAHFPPNTQCFVIAPIGSADTEVRKRSDQVLKYVIQPAVGECGYTAIRADDISEAGIITNQVIEHLIEDSMVVADLTGQNPNVFYELAIRHAVRRPCIQIIQKGERVPFDIATIRTIELDYRDLDSVESAKRYIIRQILAAQGQRTGEADSPISAAVGLSMLRNLGKFFDEVQQMNFHLKEISMKLGPLL